MMQQNHLKSILALLVLFVSFASFAFGKPSTATELKHQQKDFAVFKKGLFLIEAKPDRHISMDSIQRFVDAMEIEFSTKVLTAIEEYKWYARCINLLQNGHTQVGVSKPVVREYLRARKSLPYDFAMVNKHLYVRAYAWGSGKSKKSAAASKKLKSEQIPVGAEILAIDGQTIPEWMEKIGRFIGSDEDDPAFKYVIAGQLFDFFRFIATDEHKDYLEVDYVFKNDTIRQSVKLDFVPMRLMQERFKAEEKMADKDQKSFGKFKFIGTVGYFRFSSFKNSHGKLYSEFLKKSFKKIQKKKGVKLIVIDLRGNLGGATQPELLSYFLKESQVVGNYDIVRKLKRGERRHIKKNDEFYRYYKKGMRIRKRYGRKHPEYKGEVHSFPVDTSLIFRGQIVVLTDEATFSAASLLTSQLKTLCNAQVMGSRPGGTYYEGSPGTLHYTLPHSKISFLLNPNVCSSMLDATKIDPDVKNVDVEIVPEYSPKASTYRKNWEAVIKTAIKQARQSASVAGI